QAFLRLHTADPPRDACDPCAIEVPRVGIEPDPGSVTNPELSNIALLVVGDDTECIRIDDADQRLVCPCRIADTHGQVVDRSIQLMALRPLAPRRAFPNGGSPGHARHPADRRHQGPTDRGARCTRLVPPWPVP